MKRSKRVGQQYKYDWGEHDQTSDDVKISAARILRCIVNKHVEINSGALP